MNEMHLPEDLVAFLNEGRVFKYDATECEAGSTELHAIGDLRVQLFPMETGSLDNYENDPHYPNVNSYLVPAVDLLGSCTGDYDPVGLLMWFPNEKKYGTWDCSHCCIELFGANVNWQQIAASPARHINAQWIGMDPLSPLTDALVPWPKYKYADGQYHEPLDP